MIRILLRNVLLLSAFVASSAFGEIRNRQDLENSHDRPTVTDIKNVLNPWPSRNPWHVNNNNPRGWITKIRNEAAGIIAYLELAYPGAVICPLGRDASIFGDILDAFYQSLGQMNRVQRINASTNSFTNSTPEIIVGFLETNGLNLEKEYKGPPFILFDRTHLGDSSQSTRLLKAGYEAFIALHGREAATDFVRRFNFVSSQNGDRFSEIAHSVQSKNIYEVSPNSFEEFAEHQANMVRQHNYPKHIMGIDTTMVDGLEWHDVFGPFRYQGDRVITDPGAISDKATRISILQILYEVINQASSPDFLNHVQGKARDLGYEFPTEQRFGALELKKFELKIEELSGELQKFVDAFTNEGLEYKKKRNGAMPRFTPNGLQLSTWFQRHQYRVDDTEKLVEMFELYLLATFKALDSGKVNERDVKYLVAELLMRAEISPEFIAMFRELFKTKVSLQELWLKRREYFEDSDPKRKGGDKVPNAYRTLSMALYQDMAAMLLQSRGQSDNKSSNTNVTPIAPTCHTTFGGMPPTAATGS